MSLSVAVLGTGIMGAPMARNLAAAGLPTAAWNRTDAKARALGEDGVDVHERAEDAAAGRDVIVTMLADAGAVEEVAERALPAAGEGAVWAQMSTIGVEAAERCGRLAAGHGVAYVDAPVLGTKAPAEQGQLVVLASGPRDALDRCAPVFDAVGGRTVDAGEAGAGQRLKLVANSWVLAVVEGIAETLALAQGLGVPPEGFFDAIDGGAMDMPYVRVKGGAIANRSFEPSFPLRLAAKDAALVVAAANAAGLDLPLERTIAERMAAGTEAGYGDEDLIATWRLSAPPD
jgi:3-hydroxyisobutyrate dehydrogenase